ncbi:MAG TPA: hypothetical protein VFE58_18900 [Tepidisphaeraceae bacterium]|jgi:hypothetical protein|nr:hypothetical protein [Tepidisphaeraceae bacterium]
MVRAALLILLFPAFAWSAPFEAGSPRSVVESLSTALSAGDAATIRSILYAKTDSEKHMVDAMIAMSEAIARLRPVAIKRFGEVPARLVTGDLDASAADQHAKLESAFQQIEEDTAHLTFPDQTTDAITLKKIGGKWRIPVSEKAGKLSPVELETRAADLNSIAKSIDEVTVLCAGGKWQTPNDIVIAIQEHVLEAQKAHLPATEPTTTSSSDDSAPSHKQ